MIPFKILSTGSSGNATVIRTDILIDCGVPYKLLGSYVKNLRLVLLTHIHGDHFNRSAIKRMAAERPMLRFGCGDWLVEPLMAAGVRRTNIDVLHTGRRYTYTDFSVIPVPLVHDVPNQGYKIHFADGRKLVYATDTGTMNGVTARDYDLYMIEANHEDAEIRERIRQKEKNGIYAYEKHALHNHLSLERCNNWIYSQIGDKGEYVYMHQHRD